MAELVIVRHGQAAFGSDNYDRLSDLGRRQARAVAAHLRRTGWVPDRMVTGTLDRQVETLAEMGFDGTTERHAGFNEYDFHDLLNTRFGGQAPEPVMQDRKTHFRTLRDTILEWQQDHIAGAAESWGEFRGRVADALGFATDTDARRVLVVSSGGVIGQIVASTLGAPDPMMMELNLQVKNSSLHRFIFSRGRMMLAEFNATPHFDAAPDLLSYS
ncbi:histidine phosphatase family protein [Aliishimia ponticola]|uniref:Histidine phosphatase family protein n=1 Tax=Aliishimia ponticola TaxID=2499833 RepID=A0A4S4NF12_9RHOB|nr:histidine phosphatase family protein [Aliishimia ponticola]THH36711.1 histidine phosphatase family protein [Aliishimia ponticola]